MSTVEEFVEQLRMERLRIRMKQRDLAAALGVKGSTFSQWEGGGARPPAEVLEPWAAALNVTVPADLVDTRRALQPCGTTAAYRRHIYHGEPACGPCREAQRVSIAQYRAGSTS